MFLENAVLKICYCCAKNNVFFIKSVQVDPLDQEPLSNISHNERPDIVAFEVKAALVECSLKIFTSTPDNFNTVFELGSELAFVTFFPPFRETQYVFMKTCNST